MTEQTASTLSPAQRERIAQLRARRGQTSDLPAPAGPAFAASEPASPRRRRKRHPAQGSRVAAAGVGAVTMLGIVTVLGLDHPFVGAGDTSPSPPADPAPAGSPAIPRIQVVIHRTPAANPAGTPADEVTTTVSPDTPSEAAPPTPEAPGPIVLTANPVVQTVTVTGPPRAAPTRASSSSPTPQASAPAPAPAPPPAPAATTSGSN